MYNDIFLKFKKCAIDKCNIDLSKNNKIIAAVSGGSDSVCMLIMLCSLFGNSNIICAHFNHMIRGDESERDANFVRSLAEKFNVTFSYGEAEVPAYAKNNNLGLEEAARILRYDFLKSLAKENDYIAVAHNKGDRVETIIHNIFRGTSIDGLRGIEYVKGNIVRPLLELSKLEIEEACRYYNIIPMYDSTNSDNFYTRNKIRNKIIPFLKEEFNNSVDEHILSLSNMAVIDSEFLQRYTKQIFENICKIEYNPFYRIKINTKDYMELDLSIKRRLLRYTLSMIVDGVGITVFPDFNGIYSDMIFRIDEAFDIKDSGKIIQVASGVVCVTCGDGMYFTHEDFLENNEINCSIQVSELLLNDISEIEFKNKPLNQEYFDYNKLLEVYGENFLEKIVLRNFNEKDFLTPMGMNGKKKIRNILIDNKIGRFERNFTRVVSIDDDVLWIPEIKRSNIAPIDKNSTRVIIVKYVSHK